MAQSTRRRWFRYVVVAFVLLAAGGYLARDAIFFTFLYRGTRADWALLQLRQEFEWARFEFSRQKQGAGTVEQEQAARERLTAAQDSVKQRALQLAADNPGTKAQLGALLLVANGWPSTPDGERAQREFEERAGEADIAMLARLFLEMPIGRETRWRPFAIELVRRARAHLDDPHSAMLLSIAASATAAGTEEPQVSPEFAEIADLIVEHFAGSAEIGNFCTQLGMGDYSPAWAGPYEVHLRKILDVNQDRFVRLLAKMALASIVRDGGASRQPEAIGLFEELLDEFDGKVAYHGQGIETQVRDLAVRQLETIRALGLGQPAPATSGVDLDGNPLALADYRGKVVLVSFWATWCGPCLKMVPHERELAHTYPADKFVIVGVNVDTDLDAARATAKRVGMTWPSLRNSNAGAPQLDDQWRVDGFPTLYLVDQQGTIRKRWMGNAAPQSLDASIRQLIDGTPDSPASRELQVNSRPATSVPAAARDTTPIKVVDDHPAARGFVGKVYRSADGAESKYVVFVPHGDASPLWPAIVYLHGSGYVGRDGRAQLTGSLANAIRQRESGFPFLVVFPQAQAGSWQADSPDGRRVMAILDEVGREFPIDSARVCLTGCSMGGEGTWSLAAAFPERWAAIVPLCGGGDPETAARFKDIPCWCFHGDADRMIPPELSRRMVSALRKAGGRPIHHEYPGVDHNCWDETYANPELFEWLLGQRRETR